MKPLPRATKYLPWVAGLSLMRDLYRRHLPADTHYRIADFDGDLKFDIYPGEAIGVNLWHAPRLYEAKERAVLCSAITPGCIVLDVGANIGIYTLLAAKRGAHVFAVEADPQNAERLCHHVALNGFRDRVTIFEMAATDSEQSVLLYRNPVNSGGTSLRPNGLQPLETPGHTIDSLNFPSVDVCKMDIEGSEEAALSGMRKTIARSPGMKLLIEYNALSDQPALLALLHQTFTHICVVGERELIAHAAPPSSCNLWCWN